MRIPNDSLPSQDVHSQAWKAFMNYFCRRARNLLADLVAEVVNVEKPRGPSNIMRRVISAQAGIRIAQKVSRIEEVISSRWPPLR